MNIKLTETQKVKITNSSDIYQVMQRILLRENKIDRNREHLWVISLDNARKILNIELVSLGTVNQTLIEPMEVFSIPLQKRAVKIIIVHNHPSGEVIPGEADKDITNLLIQAGRIMKTPVLDHLIITEKTYLSFLDIGLMETLGQSLKYVPPYELKRRYEQAGQQKGQEKGKREKAREIARLMKQKGIETELIMELTGLTKAVVQRLKTGE